MKILIIGNGYLGTRCKEMWNDAILSDMQIKTVDDVTSLLKKHNPDVVLNAAGVVGKPNVDWCESHQLETIAGNTVLPIMIAEACQKRGMYLLHIGTGCVFYGYKKGERGWTENDTPNPSATYTRAKYAADLVLTTLPNVGIARIRMPLDNRPYPANIITKLASFPKVVDVTNSLTVVPDMIEVFHRLLAKRATGIFHVTNPGAISWREIMALYRELVDSTHTNQWIRDEDLIPLGLAQKKRSNTILESENLPKVGIHMRPVKEAVRACIAKYAAQNKNHK